MSVSDMEAFYERRRLHMEGMERTKQWAEVEKMFSQSLNTPRLAVMFWHSPASSPLMLPRSFVDGMISCVRNSGLNVHLLSYQPLGNVPGGVRLHDANNIFPLTKFEDMLRRVPLQLLSDFVRAQALQFGLDGASCGQ